MKYLLLPAILLFSLSTIQHTKAQNMTSKINTFLMFEGQAEEAIEFYTSLFDDSEIISMVMAGPDGPGGPQAEGTVQHALFTLKGQPYMAIDSFGHEFTFTPSISLFVHCDSEEELETLYEKLMEDGTAAMPIGDYGFSTKFAWVQDRFGVSWQLNYGELNFE